MKLIKRSTYLDKMISVIGTTDIKVITGVRRCGKSKLLEAFREYLTENDPDANIIHLNFNLPEYEEYTRYRPCTFRCGAHKGIQELLYCTDYINPVGNFVE